MTDYRGVTLMATLYKIYTIVLTEKLSEEVERKELLLHNQTRFRRGIGMIDNIYVLNYMVNKSLARKRGKMIGMFVNLKTGRC